MYKQLFTGSIICFCLFLNNSVVFAHNHNENKTHIHKADKKIQLSIPFGQLSPTLQDVKMSSGHLFEMMNLCLEHSVKAQNMPEITDIFKLRKEAYQWQTEFWGKWMLGAVPYFTYTNDNNLKEIINSSVYKVMSTQTEDGYIGNYAPDKHLDQWDVWGRKYTLSGLLWWYRVEQDKKILDAAMRLADHLLSEVGDEPGKKNITSVGNYRGMAASSILEPMIWLYNTTGEKKYLDFAEYIVKSWEKPGRIDLITKALNGVNVSERFPHPQSWWSYENGMKAYEMMSCYQGLMELYKLTGKQLYLDAVKAVAKNICETEINIAGSGAAFECWYNGVKHQTIPAYHMMETCVTVTWMRLCQSLLMVTGDPTYADRLEKTLYNAYLASLHPSGGSFSKYAPLEGIRGAGEDQCGLHTNCCIANGPRGFAVIPETMVTTSGDTVFVNLYLPSTVKLSALGNKKGYFTLEQNTSYPETGAVDITIQSSHNQKRVVMFRIPEWSSKTEISINGVPLQGVKAGGYFPVNREWKSGDKLSLNMDMTPRWTKLNSKLAVERGPVLLARDSRFKDGDIDDAVAIQNNNLNLSLEPVKSELPSGVWMGFKAMMITGTNLEREHGQPRPVFFCDFASAGNTWNDDSRYKVWLTEPLNVMNAEYKSY